MIQCLRIYIFTVFFWTLTSALASWKRNSISVQDGGYNGLLIAISKEEKEDAALIRNIKEIFTEGSSFLFEATNHRVYWKTITILVPNSWTDLAEYKPAKTETFDRANIRIDCGTSKGPYTHVIEGCGKQGQYINLTPHSTIDTGSHVGIVEFSTFGTELAPLTLVSDDSSRDKLIAALPSSVSGNFKFLQGVPLKKLRQGTMRYLSSTIDTGSYVGIVEFSTFGTELAPLTLVSDDSSRDKLIAALPSSVSGRTSIGSGVLKGIEVLSSDQSPNGGYLLVISDGKNNEWPDINIVLDDVINSGITVDTIAFTDNADNALSDLSSVSGGSAYFYSSASESITGLIDSLAATISDRSDVTNESLAILYCMKVCISKQHRHFTQEDLEPSTTEIRVKHPKEEIIQKPVDMFERSASGGAVQVANYIGVTKDRMRPSRIVDLTVTKVSYQNQSVILQWTAVGDDLDKGTVYEYDLRFSSTFQDILRNFTNSTKVTPEDVINGNLLTIKQPGQLEEFSVRLPKRGENVSYFFALIAIDEANNTGGVSNIVSANLAYIPPFNIDPEQPRNILVWTLLAVSGVGAVVFVLLYIYGIRSRHGFNPIFLFEEKTCC
ncbi:calcium-activated chloride channel regulator 2-like [Anneissia japonica]|uniref:calcium-activated chloride channel regulator 2-like n=1 Tax=Anneissia japonica TaxID=1529436 RepID=UPI0014255D49|nr:calcium-activated chloride channel regulator 2-like [Anneissia japonica]